MAEGSDWWALVGPLPTPHPAGIIAVPHDRTAVLDRNYVVGEVNLRPGGRLLREYVRAEPFDLAGVTEFESWPVIVEGAWPGSRAKAMGAMS